MCKRGIERRGGKSRCPWRKEAGSNFMRDQEGFVDFVLQVQWSFKLERRILDDNLAFSKEEGVTSSLNI